MSSGTIWNRAGTPSYASLAAGSRIPRPASRSIRAVAMAALAIAGSFVVIPQATASGTPTVDAPATAGAAPNRRAQISGISVDPGDSTSLAVHVSTDQGTLFLEDTSGLTFSAGSQNDVAEMAFNGSAQDVEDALAALYLYPPGDFEGDATFTISVADGAAWYLPETGHYYQTSGGTEVDYTTAEAAADASFFHGMQGYLFTPTSAAEKEFVADFLLGDTGYGRGWMGASDAAVEGEWRWTEGPEGEEDGGSGRVFYRDDFDGDGNPTGFAAGAVNGEYTNWISGQPNDSWGEDYGYQFGYGGWEDRDSSSEEEYVIEYGGMSGDTPAIAQDTTTVTFEPTVPGTPRYPETSSNVYMENAVRVCWSNPEEDGGRAITGYTVYVEPQDVEPVETVSTCVWIEDLYYGTDYTFTITATNEIGEGDASDEVTGTPAAGTPNTTTTTAAPTTTTTAPRPATTTTTAPRSATTTTTVAAPVASAPDAPEITEIVPASHALVVEWEATDDGGAEIARYTVRADPTTGSAGMTLKTTSGTQVSGDTTTATVDGLTNGTEYAVTVTATNAAGTSAPSAAVRGTPRGNAISLPPGFTNPTGGDMPEVDPPEGVELISVTPTPSGNGAWGISADGGVFAFGDAPFLGSMGGIELAAPIVAMAVTPSGHGYVLVGADGGVFTFGDAEFHGSLAELPLAGPTTAVIASCSGHGYYLVSTDGGVFAFGDAVFRGSMAGTPLVSPIRGIYPFCSGDGYWMYAADGGVFTFGSAVFYGSLGDAGISDVVAFVPTVTDGGYWLLRRDKTSVPFGDAT